MRGEDFVCLYDVLQIPVNIQMVSIHRCYHSCLRKQLMERAVKLVRFRDNYRIAVSQHIGAVILGNATQKCGATFSALCEDMRQ